MTARRVTILLAAGLLVIAFAIWLSSRRHLERTTLAGELVLPGLDNAVNSVTEVRLRKGDGTQTTLRKGASDWTVQQRDYAADSGKVRKLLLDLAELNVVEEKTRTPESYPRLGVEDVKSPKATGTRVEAVTPAKTYALIVGKSSGAKSGYVRVADSPQSLLATPSITLDADPRHWLDHTLIDIPQERVQEVVVKPADGPGYTVTRAKKEQQDFTVPDIPKGRELSNPAAADPIAGSLAGLTSDDVQRASQPAPGGPPNAAAKSPPPAAPVHATFRTFDGLELDFTGHKDGSRTLIAVTAHSSAKESQPEAQSLAARVKDWEFEVPSYKYDAMFRPLEELLKKPPEPAAKKTKGAGKDADKGTKKAPSPVLPGAVPPPPGK